MAPIMAAVMAAVMAVAMPVDLMPELRITATPDPYRTRLGDRFRTAIDLRSLTVLSATLRRSMPIGTSHQARIGTQRPRLLPCIGR
jgi:hypothetical protein